MMVRSAPARRFPVAGRRALLPAAATLFPLLFPPAAFAISTPSPFPPATPFIGASGGKQERQADPVATALGLADRGRLDDAISFLKESADIPGLLPALADLLVRADRIPEAEDALRRALDGDLMDASGDPDPGGRLDELRIRRASLLFRLGRYDEAGALLEDVLTRRPNHPFALYYAGSVALRRGRTEDAVRHAGRALEVFRAMAALDAGSPSTATPFPPAALAHLLFAEAKIAAGDDATAEPALRDALRLAPSHPGPRYLLGNLLLRAGRRAEGERELETFAAAKRASELVLLAEGLFRDARRPEAAERRLREALEAWPDHPQALDVLGRLLAATGRAEEAEAVARRLAAIRRR